MSSTLPICKKAPSFFCTFLGYCLALVPCLGLTQTERLGSCVAVERLGALFLLLQHPQIFFNLQILICPVSKIHTPLAPLLSALGNSVWLCPSQHGPDQVGLPENHLLLVLFK